MQPMIKDVLVTFTNVYVPLLAIHSHIWYWLPFTSIFHNRVCVMMVSRLLLNLRSHSSERVIQYTCTSNSAHQGSSPSIRLGTQKSLRAQSASFVRCGDDIRGVHDDIAERTGTRSQGSRPDSGMTVAWTYDVDRKDLHELRCLRSKSLKS